MRSMSASENWLRRQSRICASGFSMLEMLIVMIIIGVLVGIIIPKISRIYSTRESIVQRR